MLLSRFKRTDLLTIIIIVLIFIAIWTSAYLRVRGRFALYFDIDPMPLYGLLSWITGTNPLPGIIFSLFFASLMAFLMVNLNTSLIFINERTFLPAVFYALISGLFPQFQLLNPAIPGAVFLMLAVRRIMESYRVQGTAFNFFDAGLLISTGALFYANILWFGLIVFAGIAMLRTFNPKETLTAIIGLLTPFFLAAGIWYVSGRDPSEFIALFKYNLFGRQTVFALSPLIVITIFYTAALAAAGIFHILLLSGGMKIQSRKTFSLLFWILMISVAAYFAIPSASVEMLWIAGIPLSYILSHYFIFMRRKLIAEILFTVFVLLIVMIQVWYHG